MTLVVKFIEINSVVLEKYWVRIIFFRFLSFINDGPIIWSIGHNPF